MSEKISMDRFRSALDNRLSGKPGRKSVLAECRHINSAGLAVGYLAEYPDNLRRAVSHTDFLSVSSKHGGDFLL